MPCMASSQSTVSSSTARSRWCIAAAIAKTSRRHGSLNAAAVTIRRISAARRGACPSSPARTISSRRARSPLAPPRTGLVPSLRRGLMPPAWSRRAVATLAICSAAAAVATPAPMPTAVTWRASWPACRALSPVRRAASRMKRRDHACTTMVAYAGPWPGYGQSATSPSRSAGPSEGPAARIACLHPSRTGRPRCPAARMLRYQSPCRASPNSAGATRSARARRGSATIAPSSARSARLVSASTARHPDLSARLR